MEKTIEFYNKEIETPRKRNEGEKEAEYITYLMDYLRNDFPILLVDENDYETRDQFLDEMERTIVNYYSVLYKMSLELSAKVNKEDVNEKAKGKNSGKNYDEEIGADEFGPETFDDEEEDKVGFFGRIKSKFAKFLSNTKQKIEEKKKQKEKNKEKKRKEKGKKKKPNVFKRILSKIRKDKDKESKEEKRYTRDQWKEIDRKEKNEIKKRKAEQKEKERVANIINNTLNDPSFKMGRIYSEKDNRRSNVKNATALNQKNIKDAIKRYNDSAVIKTNNGTVFVNSAEFNRLIEMEMDLKRVQLSLESPTMVVSDIDDKMKKNEEQARKKGVKDIVASLNYKSMSKPDTDVGVRYILENDRYDELKQQEDLWKLYCKKAGSLKEKHEQEVEEFNKQMLNLLTNGKSAEGKGRQKVK